MTTHKKRTGWRLLAAYVALNAAIFFINPYASPWHYGSRHPSPIAASQPTYASLTVDEIVRTLDAIDLAYKAREPSTQEQWWRGGLKLMAVVCLPASAALGARDFFGYMGPANREQQAFTLSVKRRYNHLARLAVTQGMAREGFLFQEEPSLTKKNGPSFESLRRQPGA